MLRLLALLLLLANGAYFAWSHELLRLYGLGPVQQSEPQRVAQQIRPQELLLLKTAVSPRAAAASAPAPASAPPSAPASVAAVAAAPSSCLQAGPYDEQQSAVLRLAASSTLPAGSWSMARTVVPAHWIVYMGKYADADAVDEKKAELKLHDVTFEALTNPALAPGLSLGGFDSREAAALALAGLARRGVRTARVVQDRAELHGQLLTLPAVDDKLRAQLDALKTALAGKALQACPLNH